MTIETGVKPGGSSKRRSIRLLTSLNKQDLVSELASRQGNLGYLVYKELGKSIMNGIVWGAVVGAFALVFYSKISLAVLMAVAALQQHF